MKAIAQKNVLILGATSDLAQALAVQCAQAGATVTLAARDRDRLAILTADLTIRYQVPVYGCYFDALDFASHQAFYDALPARPDVCICVFGVLGDQQQAEHDWAACATILHSNYTGAVSILNIVANDFEARQAGLIVGISSVAGDRGRQSNYLYGSAKAGFTAYLSGLRNRLYKSHVHVMTVKPGFMKTRMTEGMKTPAPLTAAPEQAAMRIIKAMGAQKNIYYVFPLWRWIMLIIVCIPEFIFKKLKL